MRVLVLNANRPERDTIARALQQASCTVEALGDVKGALNSIGHEAPEVLLLAGPSTGGVDLVRLVRGADASGQMFVVVLLDGASCGREIPLLLAAGAHEVLRRPIVDAELVARVQAPIRLVKWAKTITKTTVFDLSTTVDVSQLAVWKTMGDVVAADLTQMVGENAQARPGWPKTFGRDLRGATIPMSLASDQVEVRISIMADRPALKWLAGALLGDPNADEASMNDVLRELANTAGGAVKRSALPDNITLTTGMPSNESAVRFQGDGVCAWTLPIDTGKAFLAIVGEIRPRENQRVPAANLREGMVLVHDLRSDSGALLVTAGSRLTSTTAARVAQMLGPRFLVDVACAA